MLPKLQIFSILHITCGTNLLHLKKNETLKVHLNKLKINVGIIVISNQNESEVSNYRGFLRRE